ncbi:MAG: heme ABC transporter permease [Hyphomicrobiales bacterium]|nr:heme ABC transporter permease [Hyphomicrobiales bacterium]
MVNGLHVAGTTNAFSKQLHGLANPARFLRFCDRILPWASGLTLLLMVAGGYLSLFHSPADYQQGQSVRIMYVHVPAAWMAMFSYAGLAISAAVGLIWRHTLAELAAQAIAPIGACFTFLALITGSLWGKPMWGTWWVWDARLTSVLILFFLYLGFIALSHAFDDPGRGRRASAILALVGLVNVPIIKFSVDWWSTLHQPASVVRLDGPSIHPSMLVPLLVMAAAFTGYFVVVLIFRLRAQVLDNKIRAVQVRRAAC